MKRLFIVLLAIGMMATASAQMDSTKQETPKAKQDTTIQILLPLDYYRSLLYVIDQNIDSKKLSKEIFELIGKSASIYQPADKPKEAAKAPEKAEKKKQ